MGRKYLLSLFVLAFPVLCRGDDLQTTELLEASRNGAILVAAHRGGYSNDKADQAPENTLANLAIAIRKGYDVYETDIQRTSDGVFVVVHDPTLDRETNATGKAKDLTLAELKALKKRYRDGSVSNESVATLEELLLAGRGKILFKPDLKPGIIDHFDDLARLVSKLGMTDQVFIRTVFKDTKKIQAYFESGTPKVEVMIKTRDLSELRHVITTFHPKAVHVDLVKDEPVSASTSEAIRFAVKSEVLVQTHIYKDTKQIEELAELGVRMLHTNYPEETLEYLVENDWR
ncbi:MAG: glycerophosphodiester phosphodiesterase family protein [Opitutales bacterium]|jgi:glycerophosphoryl diester phosphodiesterase|nr:glycerophosphodiester phosphodiesterase family protein [Opitutales bacterium]MDG2255380.1 glycerophosphodiester phosphodiesterase family protein [Opitutaceae bacterium]MBT5814266.1 glycerophosphodiester phosphodiesterase family protein [Opitutales bacterium]MBT6379130.1 glycerophosphodiester phosphodiesterase family protein [Opitutales bacterium]MBT6770464.1 glycerophosphodiester phosphodiesterase family protein [Opitutales bacterium]